jgi:hypothetical protein
VNLADAYLVGSYTEFLVLLPYLARTHEERGLISMRERALGEVKRILESNMILAHVVNEIADLMTQLKKDPTRAQQLNSNDIQELKKAASKWRSEIIGELESSRAQ